MPGPSDAAAHLIARLRSRRILVTGASGFIGTALCERLVGLGAEVHGVSRTATRSERGPIREWTADLGDFDAVRKVFAQAQPHIVFHLAGYVYGARGIEHVRPALQGNLIATVNVLESAHASSCERVIVTGSQDEPDADEPHAARFVPSSPYAAAKLAANAYARTFHALYGLPVSIARILMAYGPGQKDLQKLIPYVILALARGETPRLSSASRPLDWIYIADVVTGLLLMATRENLAGRTIDLGTGTTHTAREAVEKIVKLMGSPIVPAFGALDDRALEQRRAADVAATRALLGWAPATSFESGLQQTIDWYTREER
jgi:nucleoside-diphosphate-sugar epimerase